METSKYCREKDINKWNYISRSRTGCLFTVKTATLPKTTHRLKANPYKNLNDIICRNRKIHLTIHMESQQAWYSQNNRGEEKQS